jgi:hypothetical protein
MKPPLSVRKQALADIRATMAWYESQMPGLGDLFLSRVEERMRVLSESPHVYPQVLETIRHFKQSLDRLRDRA